MAGEQMRAVVSREPQPADQASALLDIDLPRPVPTGRDLLVAIRAVSVNPIDTKVRMRPLPATAAHRVLGYDAAGVVEAVGPEATAFAPGDEVFYAGSIDRPGTNSAFHLVDERIVGRKPRSLSFAEAAAMPLTTITAWEMLFDRLDVRQPVPGAAGAVLIVGGAGGVGSMSIQLLRQMTELTVIATASRPETQDWCRALGAHHVIDHRRPLAADVAALDLGAPGHVFATTSTDKHFTEIVELLQPQGRFGLIDDPKALDVTLLKRKSLSLHWELMFTRSSFATPDMGAQGALLTEVAELVDQGTLRTTIADHFGTITAANLLRAHRLIESGAARGKIVLEGF